MTPQLGVIGAQDATFDPKYDKEYAIIPRIPIKLGRCACYALVDTGANDNFIGENLAKNARASTTETSNQFAQLAAYQAMAVIKGRAAVEMVIQGVTYEITCLVIPDLSEGVILGKPWLSYQAALLDLGRNCMHLGRVGQTIYWSEPPEWAAARDPPAELVKHLEEPQRTAFHQVLYRFSEVFDDTRPPSTTLTTQHIIHLKDEIPVRT